MEVNRLVNAAFAPATKATYAQARKSFDEFRQAQGLPCVWPALESHVVKYAAFLSLENKSHATARTYIAALSTYHKLRGWDDPTDSFLLKKLLQGFTRSNHQVDSRLPITFDKLVQLISSLDNICENTFEVQLFTAAFSLAFFGFMRISELVGQSKQGRSNRLGLQISDVQLGPELVLHLRASKTDQRGRGSKVHLQAVRSTPTVCPIQALQSYLSCRP